jgi:transposase InsO family protein
MEAIWIGQRSHLYQLFQRHPEWTRQQFADAVGCSLSMVKTWRKRFREAGCLPDPHQEAESGAPPPASPHPSLFLSRSRARHHPSPRLDPVVKERIIAMRLDPPEHLHRTPGPKALLYYLPRDEVLKEAGVRLPTSTSTIHQILDDAGLIAHKKQVVHQPFPPQEPLEEVQVDFKDVTTVLPDLSDPSGKKQHVVETVNFVDAGTSLLLFTQVHADFHAETAFLAVVEFLKQYGLPTMMTFDRDTRWVGSASGRDFPSALRQFLECVGVFANILPPERPDLNAFVERYNKTYKEECLLVVHPSTLEEARDATEAFQEHYNVERPHQGRANQNQPPRVAHPILPTRPSLPTEVNPDAWLDAIDGQCYPRQVKTDGCVRVDGLSYYVKKDLAKQTVVFRLNALDRCFDVLHDNTVFKSISIKGLIDHTLPLEAYINLMAERARSEERERLRKKRYQRMQAS